jgi:hypothetical protein
MYPRPGISWTGSRPQSNYARTVRRSYLVSSIKFRGRRLAFSRPCGIGVAQDRRIARFLERAYLAGLAGVDLREGEMGSRLRRIPGVLLPF